MARLPVKIAVRPDDQVIDNHVAHLQPVRRQVLNDSTTLVNAQGFGDGAQNELDILWVAKETRDLLPNINTRCWV